jgi:hypothetical protein
MAIKKMIFICDAPRQDTKRGSREEALFLDLLRTTAMLLRGPASILKKEDLSPTKSYVRATIDAISINTRHADRDAHLKSTDFFHAEQFRTLSFVSTRATRQGADKLAVEGDLTISDVTRKVVFEVEGPTAPHTDPWGKTLVWDCRLRQRSTEKTSV